MRSLDHDLSCTCSEDALRFSREATEAGDVYFSYLWLLVAADAGSNDAEELADAMRDAGELRDEDVTHAHYQLASWYHTGSHVNRDARCSLEHLVHAARSHGLRLQRRVLSSLPPADALRKVGEDIGVPRDAAEAR
jgi:hypothetical protein